MHGHAQQQAEVVLERKRAELAVGCRDGFAQDHESSMASERAADRDVFSGVIGFVESLRSLEPAAGAEDEAAGCDSAQAQQPDEESGCPAFVPHRVSVQLHGGAATDRAVLQRVQRRAQDGGIDQGVGIDEDEHFALCVPCAGVAGRGDMPMPDANHLRTMRRCDFGGRVGGRIVDNDHFMSDVDRRNGAVQRGECRCEVALFVVGGNDEREQ